MKVICTNHKNFTNLPCNPAIPRPAIGEEVTVIKETCYYGIDCYIFDEYKAPVGTYVYDKRNFSPLSDLEETTLVTEEFEEKYCVPVLTPIYDCERTTSKTSRKTLQVQGCS